MSERLSGTVTFLFTDLEGSTELLQQLGDVSFMEASAAHDRYLRAAFEAAGAEEISSRGDGFLVVFGRAQDGVAAAIAAQRALAAHAWPSGLVLRTRMGLHTGEPMAGTTDYVGLDVNRAARICAAGYGGQILLSQATALLVYSKLPGDASLRDLGRHRLKDLREPERIFQVLHPALPADFPPLRSERNSGQILPWPLSSFVGRERELADVRRLLASTRLLTITGTGGCGKTRMSLATATAVLEEYPDGVRFVELAALSDPALVLPTVAAAVDVREVPGHSLQTVLVEDLRSKQLLLILDNCEHLVEACATLVAALLQACPGLRVLATSRETLGVPGETVWRVPSLSFPDPRQLPPQDALMEYEAVRLFVERAAAVQQNFALTPENARAVADVCRRLDGIPLAIELAAARIPTLPVEEIAVRLRDRFRLLTRGSRTALPRQQTLRAAMDWGYHLLSVPEQTALRRLSIFAGSWTLDAAEAICEGSHVNAQDVMDLLTQLAFKSWVFADEERGRVRYRCLETIVQYGRERLSEAGEGDAAAARTRHLDWYLRLAQDAEPTLVGAGQAAELDRLETEHDNLRIALDWAVQSGNVEAGLRLATAVWRFWFIRGYLGEGRQWLNALLGRDGVVTLATRAKALWVAGRLAGYGQGDYAAGRAMCEQSLAIWRTLGNERGIATVIGDLGVVAFGQVDIPTARACHQESLEIWRRLGDRRGIAISLHNLGRVEYHEGSWDAARRLFEESMTIWQEIGDTQNSALARTNLGFVALNCGDHTSAAREFAASLAAQRELGDRRRMAYSLEGFAFLAIAQGDAARGARLFGAVEAFRESVGSRLFPLPGRDRMVAQARALLGEEAFVGAWAAGRTMTLVQAIEEADATSTCSTRPAVDSRRRT